jgi:murein DD-endopeptidase MepM/ murein hydrolase activator NlpD
MVTHIHNLNQGGAGLAVYRVSEPVATSGVQVADQFFPGMKGYFSDTDAFLVYFALPFDKGPETRLSVIATDVAGNIGRSGFSYHINAKTLKTDTIRISDGFLRQKMPEFEGIPGVGNQPSLIETFLKVNRDLRQANYQTIQQICNTSDPVKHWDGGFVRLPASARKAGFADRRTYKHNGKAVDQQVHLGVDLAATSSFPVPSANSGRIAFADDLGIYGRTVIVDHGFFVFSMYSHLSRIQVAKDQTVSKGDTIGFTGRTGLAGGDHLHFSMLIYNTFVNPIEWWDSTWIKHNITDKLKTAAESIGTN